MVLFKSAAAQRKAASSPPFLKNLGKHIAWLSISQLQDHQRQRDGKSLLPLKTPTQVLNEMSSAYAYKHQGKGPVRKNPSKLHCKPPRAKPKTTTTTTITAVATNKPRTPTPAPTSKWRSENGVLIIPPNDVAANSHNYNNKGGFHYACSSSSSSSSATTATTKGYGGGTIIHHQGSASSTKTYDNSDERRSTERTLGAAANVEPYFEQQLLAKPPRHHSAAKTASEASSTAHLPVTLQTRGRNSRSRSRSRSKTRSSSCADSMNRRSTTGGRTSESRGSSPHSRSRSPSTSSGFHGRGRTRRRVRTGRDVSYYYHGGGGAGAGRSSQVKRPRVTTCAERDIYRGFPDTHDGFESQEDIGSSRIHSESESSESESRESESDQNRKEKETWLEKQHKMKQLMTLQEIKPSELELQEKPFGKGYFGKVFAGIHLGGAGHVAVKQIEKVADPTKLLERDALILQSCGHENIVRLMGAHVFPEEGSNSTYTVQLVMPKSCTDLGKVIQDPRHVPSCLRKFIGDGLHMKINLQLATQMARPIALLHGTLGVIHRDIKPQNFLLEEGFKIKMCDFGCCCKLPPGKTSLENEDVMGDVRYFAPELLEQVAIAEHFVDESGQFFYAEHTASTAADVYSLGLTFGELFTGQEQFHKDRGWDDRIELYQSVCVNGDRPGLPPTMHPGLRDLITRMWDSNPTSRPSIKEVIETLTRIRIGLQLKDTEVTQWWFSNFGAKETVQWDEFVAAVAEDSREYLPGIKKLACDDTTDTVTTTRCRRLLRYLGFGFMSQKSLLTDMNNWTREHWFLPFATDQDCEDILREEKEFIVRIKQTKDESGLGRNKKRGLQFCVRQKGRVSYKRIRTRDNGREQKEYVYKHKGFSYQGVSPIELMRKLMGEQILGSPCTRITYNNPMQLTRIVVPKVEQP
ncbi:Dual specificity protein kinase [Pelomyxa schiedti]|nr:Dual specificity protein kinase [Pelomyxa schiedti]